MTQKLDKWDRWLQVIYEDMRHQATSRTVFRETAAIIVGNPLIPKESDFLDFLEQWYVDSAVMGLRRQIKIHPDSISLAGLLDDIAANTGLLSRQRFVNLYPKAEHRRAESVFDKHIGPRAAHVDATGVRTDLEKLRQLAAQCEQYADRLVAHRDRRGLQAVPTYPELNDAIDFSEGLLQRYYLLLRGDWLESVTAKLLHPWKRVFEVPWIPSRLTTGSSGPADAGRSA
jgi:hypothetical protein